MIYLLHEPLQHYTIEYFYSHYFTKGRIDDWLTSIKEKNSFE